MNQTQDQLAAAARAGDLDAVRKCVEAGANVNAPDSRGAGLLLNFDVGVTEYLLSQGADPNRQHNEFGASVLAGLCYVNSAACVKLLLEHGADPNLGRVESGETPLHHALCNGPSHEIVQQLVKHHADVNFAANLGVESFNFSGRTPTRGETPLHRAAAYGSPEIIEILISAGADLSLADAFGHLPVHWAGWHHQSREIVQKLMPRKV